MHVPMMPVRQLKLPAKFTLVIKQKKDKMAGLIVEGGYAAE